MKILKRILFLFVFITGMAVTQNVAAQQPLTPCFWVKVNLTQDIGGGGQYIYNNPNAILYIVVTCN